MRPDKTVKDRPESRSLCYRYNHFVLRRSRIWLAALLILAALALRWIPGPRTIDDAYITFRYARNLLAGEGFVYNPGERVMGTTTPLYTLLMAGLGAAAGGTRANFPWIALVVNSLADAGTCLLLWRIGRKINAERAGLAAAFLWAMAPYSVTFAIGGLETSLYVFLLTSAAAAYLEGRLALTGFSAALGLLTRVDAVLLIAPLGLDWLVRRVRGLDRGKFAGAALAFGLPLAAWYGFAGLYFGSVLPHSVEAKLVAYRLAANESFIRLIQHYATPFFQQNWLGAAGVAVGLVLFPFLSFLGARRLVHAQSRITAWVVYPWLYLLAFALPNPLIFRWYLTPPLPAYFLCILAGLDAALSRLIHPERGRLRSAVVGAVLVGISIGLSASEWRLHPDHGADRPAPDMAYIQLEGLYRQAAGEVNAIAQPGWTLAAGDVGVLGFETGLRILDTVGLNSPESLKYYPLDANQYVINYAVAPDLIADQRPDAVVILEVYGRKGLLVDPRFQSDYRLVQKIPTDMYGSDGMLIYVRQGE